MLDFTLFILTFFVTSIFFIVVDSKTKIKIEHIKADSYVRGEIARAKVYMEINEERNDQNEIITNKEYQVFKENGI